MRAKWRKLTGLGDSECTSSALGLLGTAESLLLSCLLLFFE